MKALVSLTLTLCLGLAATLQAGDLEFLRSNGSVFYRGEERLPLRCLDQPGLLSLSDSEQEALLNRAAAAGFNSVSFSAPLFGDGAFCQKLGQLDGQRVAAFRSLITKMEFRRLYAFPVLWDAGSVQAFGKLGGGEEKFFSGKIQNQWEAWLLKETISEASLSGTAGVGAWILYRGPWPGPQQRQKVQPEEKGPAQSFTASQRAWLLWQLRALRQQARAQQLAGIGYELKGDLAEKKSQGGDVDDVDSFKASGPPPLPEALSNEALQPAPKPTPQDQLPPLPGAGKLGASADDLTPWDLEGVDWDSVGRAMKEVPVATGLDFMELTLDTEDWYRIGETLSDMAAKNMQAPLLWRQDWRRASRYERQKHLEAPEALAGLSGPWPDLDWPAVGESIWPLEAAPTAASNPLLFKYLEISKDDEGRPVLALHLNRPCEIELSWGKAWPLTRSSASKDPALVHLLSLKGAHFGESVLFSARASSPRWGSAVLRSRWVLLKAPAPAAKPLHRPRHKRE